MGKDDLWEDEIEPQYAKKPHKKTFVDAIVTILAIPIVASKSFFRLFPFLRYFLVSIFKKERRKKLEIKLGNSLHGEKKAITHGDTPEIEIQNDLLCLEWVYLGEGLCGDYNPDDPDDNNA